MIRYALTRRAEGDLVDIFLHGIEQFGPKQARVYKDDLDRCFQRLAENPGLGRPARSIGGGVRRHEHGSHVILYESHGSRILILAVVHGRSIRGLKI